MRTARTLCFASGEERTTSRSLEPAAPHRYLPSFYLWTYDFFFIFRSAASSRGHRAKEFSVSRAQCRAQKELMVRGSASLLRLREGLWSRRGEPLCSVDAPTPLLLRSPPLAKVPKAIGIATTSSGKSSFAFLKSPVWRRAVLPHPCLRYHRAAKSRDADGVLSTKIIIQNPHFQETPHKEPCTKTAGRGPVPFYPSPSRGVRFYLFI